MLSVVVALEWPSARCTVTMLAWRSGLIDADADQLVEHLAAIGTALAPRFLKA